MIMHQEKLELEGRTSLIEAHLHHQAPQAIESQGEHQQEALQLIQNKQDLIVVEELAQGIDEDVHSFHRLGFNSPQLAALNKPYRDM